MIMVGVCSSRSPTIPAARTGPTQGFEYTPSDGPQPLSQQPVPRTQCHRFPFIAAQHFCCVRAAPFRLTALRRTVRQRKRTADYSKGSAGFAHPSKRGLALCRHLVAISHDLRDLHAESSPALLQTVPRMADSSSGRSRSILDRDQPRSERHLPTALPSIRSPQSDPGARRCSKTARFVLRTGMYYSSSAREPDVEVITRKETTETLAFSRSILGASRTDGVSLPEKRTDAGETTGGS